MEVEYIFLEIVAMLQAAAGPTMPLPAPATSDEIVAAERELGFSLPESLRRIYMVHNGELQSAEKFPSGKTILGVFYDFPFLDLDAMLYDYKCWASVRTDLIDCDTSFDAEIQSEPAESSKEVYSDPAWVTFAGNCLALDFAPGPTGVTGQVINFGRDDLVHFQIAKDFDSFLEGVLQSYRRRKRNTRFGCVESWTSLYDELMQPRRAI